MILILVKIFIMLFFIFYSYKKGINITRPFPIAFLKRQENLKCPLISEMPVDDKYKQKNVSNTSN